MFHARKQNLRVEVLEDRTMFAVGLMDHGTLVLLGTNHADNIQVSMQGSDVVVNDGGTTPTTYSGASVPTRIAIVGLGGDDTITVDANVTMPIRIDAGKGNDTLQGGSGNNIIIGGAGNDSILTRAGNDQIFGGSGDDTIDAGTGNDKVAGGKGNDIIHGGDGDDQLFGEAGNDELYGELGADICVGGAGDDRVDGGALNDQLFGDAGIDLLLGGDGDDFLNGGAGNDTCRGGLGNDKIKGGLGNDLLDGEGGNNLLDQDQGTGALSNGLAVDLDRESTAIYQRGQGPVKEITADFTLANENGALAQRLVVNDYYALPNGSHDIVVGDQTIGQIAVSSSFASVTFTTNPTGSEQPIPGNFPEVSPGIMAQVGAISLSKFKSIHATSYSVPKAPVGFI